MKNSRIYAIISSFVSMMSGALLLLFDMNKPEMLGKITIMDFFWLLPIGVALFFIFYTAYRSKNSVKGNFVSISIAFTLVWTYVAFVEYNHGNNSLASLSAVFLWGLFVTAIALIIPTDIYKKN